MVQIMMATIRLMAITVLVSAVLGGCVTTPDGAMSSRLLGKWSQRIRVDDMYVEHSTELRADGKLERRGVVRDAQGSRPYSARGVWRVKNAVYYEDIESSDFPGWKRRPETHHALVTVSDWEWVMKEEITGE